MELSRNSPDSERSDQSIDDDAVINSDGSTIALGTANGMATMVAHPQPAANGALGQQAQKRYRPAPAKTFQCRGYGECRMVFSRSEHLARHIRKHTGERPFSCHCGKQFSRLDNLRQHAQTVHADKQEQNEQMMRDLTTLHASMAAANKGGGRGTGAGGRRGAAAASAAIPTTANSGHQVGGNAPKQEEVGLGLSLRPGTSTGYEGDMWTSTSPSAPAGGNHSFRDSRESSQSFLGSHGSFRAYGDTHRPFTSAAGYPSSANGVERRPSTATAPPPSLSRPTTSSGPPDPSRTLPPLSAVVSASLAPSPPPALGHHHSFVHGSFPHPGNGLRNELPFPFRRPTTATRPGTAPAFFAKSSSASSYASGYGGVAPARERELLSSRDGLGSRHAGPGGEAGGGGGAAAGWDYEQGHDSPFYFNAPSVADNQPGVPSTGSSSTPGSSAPSTSTSTGTASSHGIPTPTAATSPGANPRKRGFGGPDGPAYDDDVVHAHREPPRSSHGVYGGAAGFVEREPPRSSHGGYGGHRAREYEYGSESRPASRRISVMELCNDTDADPPRSSHGLRPQSSGTFAFHVPSSGTSAIPSATPFSFNPPPTAPSSTTGPRTPGVLSPSTSSSSAGGGRPASAYAAFGLSSRTTSTSSFRRSPSSTSPSSFLYSHSRPTTGTTATGRRPVLQQHRSTASPESRPTTSSGLVASAATLHIFDRGSPIAVDAYERERGEQQPQREEPYERRGYGGYERQHGEYGYGRRGYEQREPTDSPSSRLSPYPEQYGGDDRRSGSPASSASAATPIFAFSAPASAPGGGDGDAAAAARGREGRYAEEVASQRLCESSRYEERAAADSRAGRVYAAASGDVFERVEDAPRGAGSGYARRYGGDEREYERGYERGRDGEYERDYRGGGRKSRGEWNDDERGRRWRDERASSGDDGEEEFGAFERERVFTPPSPPQSAGGSAAAVRRVSGDAAAGPERGSDARVLQRVGSASAAAAVDDAYRERERVFGYGGVLPGGDAAAAAARGRAAEDERADGDARADGGDEEAARARDEADARVDGDSAAASPATAVHAPSTPAAPASASALAAPALASSSSRSPSATAASAAASASSTTPPAAHALPAGTLVRAAAAGAELDADGAAGVSRGVPAADAAERKRESGWEYRERERFGYERGVKYERGQRERGWGDVKGEERDVDVEMRDVQVKREVGEVEMSV